MKRLVLILATLAFAGCSGEDDAMGDEHENHQNHENHANHGDHNVDGVDV